MTFVNDDESVGVVVTAFVNGYIKKDGEGNRPIYGYNLNQSEEEQKRVKSLEDIMAGKDKVEFLIIVLSSLIQIVVGLQQERPDDNTGGEF
jgi:hypothetical protein